MPVNPRTGAFYPGRNQPNVNKAYSELIDELRGRLSSATANRLAKAREPENRVSLVPEEPVELGDEDIISGEAIEPEAGEMELEGIYEHPEGAGIGAESEFGGELDYTRAREADRGSKPDDGVIGCPRCGEKILVPSEECPKCSGKSKQMMPSSARHY